MLIIKIEFEREHRDISLSLGHDIWNLPRKTQSLEVTLVTRVLCLPETPLACLAASADVFSEDFGVIGGPVHVYVWPHHVTAWAPHSIVPGFQDRVLHSNQVEAMLPFMTKP